MTSQLPWTHSAPSPPTSAPGHSLTSRSAAQVCRDVFVYPAPVADGENLEAFARPIHRVHDPIAPHPVLPESVELPHERCPAVRGLAERPNGGFDAAFEVRREVADDVCDVGRNVRLKDRSHRGRTLGGVRNSPKTSSNDRPRAPRA